MGPGKLGGREHDRPVIRLQKQDEERVYCVLERWVDRPRIRTDGLLLDIRS
jgi:hypothetical protein